MILFFDTETTGLVRFDRPAEDPSQPRMVQLAMILTEDDGRERASFCSIVYPNTFVIPENMVHGISQKDAEANGISGKSVIHMYAEFANMANTHVGHNIKFDKYVVEHELYEHGQQTEYLNKNTFCTMLASTNICQIKGPRGYKWPKLREAYKYFFNEELVDAHDALNDIRATKRIYFELKRRGAPTPALLTESKQLTV